MSESAKDKIDRAAAEFSECAKAANALYIVMAANIEENAYIMRTNANTVGFIDLYLSAFPEVMQRREETPIETCQKFAKIIKRTWDELTAGMSEEEKDKAAKITMMSIIEDIVNGK